MTQTTLAIWEKFSQQLRSFICRYVSPPADADDILQEVFLKIHTNIDRLQHADRLLPWLYRITRNTITDYYRTKQHEESIPEGVIINHEPTEDDLESQLAVGLRYVIDTLPDKYRRALVLTELQGFS